MNQSRTTGIVLQRVNYGEADRVVTFLTPDQGLVSVMVKGARRQGSKLAAGIELLAENDITFIRGKGELSHLISSRMIAQYRHILEDYDRVAFAYEAIKFVHKAARQFDEPASYSLLKTTLESLNDVNIPTTVIEAWYKLNLLRILGQQPNLTHDVTGEKLRSSARYSLLPDDGAFRLDEQGTISAEHIKAWRVLITTSPSAAAKISGVEEALSESLAQVNHLFEYQLP